MATRSKAAESPLVAAAQAFDATLGRFAALSAGLRKGTLDSKRNLERAAEALKEVAGCEEELQAHAQALMAALCKAYAAQVEAGRELLPLPARGGATATDVMITASGLLKAADLAVFELGMWQSWTGR